MINETVLRELHRLLTQSECDSFYTPLAHQSNADDRALPWSRATDILVNDYASRIKSDDGGLGGVTGVSTYW